MNFGICGLLYIPNYQGKGSQGNIEMISLLQV